MNGKFEERLARLAFGDTTPEEARELEREARANPEAAQVLTEYRAMRDGLRGLGADVPPDQLSKDRLRDAILGQGLRPTPEPTSSVWGWVWMPVLAGALAFGMFTMRDGSSSDDPTIVVDNGKTPSYVMNLPEPSPTTSVSEPVVAKPPTEVEKPVAKLTLSQDLPPQPRRPRRSRPRPPIVIQDRWVEVIPEREDDTVVGGVMASAKRPEPTPAVASNDQPPVEPVLTSAPIVLIDASKNADTGANTATEVGTASNVLVGG